MRTEDGKGKKSFEDWNINHNKKSSEILSYEEFV